jgi:hypothetical protein
VSEKAAASLIVRKWREKKGVRLRVARRRADEAFRGLSVVSSGETTVGGGGDGRLVERVGSNA